MVTAGGSCWQAAIARICWRRKCLPIQVRREIGVFVMNVGNNKKKGVWPALVGLLSIIMSQRKQALRGKDTSGTPTRVANPSPSRQPIRSPLTASKYIASASKPNNVSYGELQIVLENIQEIRKKANHQIALLTAENDKLRDELTHSHQNLEELMNRLHKSNSKNDFEIKIIDQLEAAESDKKALEAQIQERAKAEAELESKNESLQRVVQEKEEQIGELEGKIEEWASKWRWAFGILAGDAGRSEELIWKVKNQYCDGIWGIFEENSANAHQLSLKTGRLDILERELAETRLASKQTNALLERSMAEVTLLNHKLSTSEQDLAATREKCHATENQLLSDTKDFKFKEDEYKSEIGRLQAKLVAAGREKEEGLRELAERTVRLEEQLVVKNQQMQEKQRQEEYSSLIGEVCEESQDYGLVLERLRYLEKFKAEHYFNVEKIQYLCKMLDY